MHPLVHKCTRTVQLHRPYLSTDACGAASPLLFPLHPPPPLQRRKCVFQDWNEEGRREKLLRGGRRTKIPSENKKSPPISSLSFFHRSFMLAKMPPNDASRARASCHAFSLMFELFDNELQIGKFAVRNPLSNNLFDDVVSRVQHHISALFLSCSDLLHSFPIGFASLKHQTCLIHRLTPNVTSLHKDSNLPTDRSLSRTPSLIFGDPSFFFCLGVESNGNWKWGFF